MNKYRIILCILLFSLTITKGQVNTYNPYSSYAIGQLSPVGHNYNISMGGLGTSLASNQYLNYTNPASYSFLDRTSFEFGMRSSFINMFQNNTKQKNFISGLTSIGLGFPISNRFGLSASLLPYSSVGYNVQTNRTINSISLDPLAESTTIIEGSGGINKFLLGTSFKILKNLSFGANINYLFGSIEREEHLYTNPLQWHLREINAKFIRGFNFDFGLLYFHLMEDYKFNMGFSVRPAKEINTQSQTVRVRSLGEIYYPANPDNEIQIDEVSNHQTNFPLESSVGISIEDNKKWLLGLDYKYINWDNYYELGKNTCCMQNSHEFIFGGFFTPKKDDIYNYFNRVQYRFGLSYSSGYLDYINHFSGTLGLALPINRVVSTLNIALKYGVMSPSELMVNPIKEQYFSIYLSMTLNEKWFQKIKIQ